MAEAYIVDAVRTPRGIGKQGKGALAHLHPHDLGATVLRALRDRNSIDTSKVDDIVWSCSQQRGKQGGDIGRLSALWAGYDNAASGVTLDRFCGGGISSVGFGAGQIMAGFEDVVIAGGTEMMSYHTELDALESQTELGKLGRARGNFEFYRGSSDLRRGRRRRCHRRDGRHQPRRSGGAGRRQPAQGQDGHRRRAASPRA
jgi:acetyl-CoA C-acetyltransferase